MTERVNIRDLTDNARIRPLHIAILAICFLTAVVDGLDNQVIGFTAPAIALSLGVKLSGFGAVFSAGLIGTLVGAVALGRLADKIGRQRALIFCTLLFAVFTLATPLSRSIVQLSLLRFVGGLGLGGAMPCFLTLGSEYAPKTRKALATGLLWCGYPTGGMIGALVGARILSQGGWQAIFYFGGGLALIAALAQWLFLPESLQFLALQGAQRERIRRIAAKLAPELNLDDVQFVADDASAERARVREVFAEGRAWPTILLWIPLFMTFTITTCTVLWMPGLLKTAGMPIATAALMQALGNLASLPSMAGAGLLLDKVHPVRLLPATYGALAAAFVILALYASVAPIVAIAVVLIGLLGGPGIAGMLSLTTSFYPSRVRSTGVGLAMGVGRSGQVAASLVVGAIIASGASVTWTILAMSLPPLIALICVVLLGRDARSRQAGAAIIGSQASGRLVEP